jgi:phosphopantetheinyl transferase (holo-ACP synthase)
MADDVGGIPRFELMPRRPTARYFVKSMLSISHEKEFAVAASLIETLEAIADNSH